MKGDENEAAGFAIKAIDERNSAIREMIPEPFEQGVLSVRPGGVNQQVGWFVDNGKVLGGCHKMRRASGSEMQGRGCHKLD